jgi:parallel beta-helix repeat protein
LALLELQFIRGVGIKIFDNKIQAINSTGVLIIDSAETLTISGNAIGNCEQAILIEAPTSGSIISGNTLTRNIYGIYLFGSFHNSIVGNSIRDNIYGIYTESVYTVGNFWYYSQDNNITCNIISGNSAAGIFLNTTSQYGFIVNNEIKNNSVGVKIEDNSSPNTFYSNNFVDNNVSVTSFPWRENWNSTYSVGGNYWSSYIGIDSDGDGIGNTEHTIDENNSDHYPLIKAANVPALEVPPALPEFLPTEPEEPEEPETPENPEQPTEEPTLITAEDAILTAVAATCIISIAVYWIMKKRK